MTAKVTNLICHAAGHWYKTDTFQVNKLYHCTRCGKELLNRTVDDLEVMNDVEMEQFYLDQMHANDQDQEQVQLTPSYFWGFVALIVVCLALWAVSDPIPDSRPAIDPLPCPSYVCATPSYLSPD